MSPYASWDFDIAWTEDWIDPLPQIIDEEGATLDLTGKSLELYVRPAFDYTPFIVKLTSPASGITIDDAAQGLATVSYVRASVQTAFPEPVGGRPSEFRWFLLLKDGTAYKELARGPIRLHPGLTGA